MPRVMEKEPRPPSGGAGSRNAGRPSPKTRAVAARYSIGTEDQRIAGATTRAIAHLEMLLDAVERQLVAGQLTAALQRESANVARALVALSAARRAQEAAERKRGAAMTAGERLELVKAWLADRGPEDCAEVRDYLTALAAETRLLE
jgi:hypothetical protein